MKTASTPHNPSRLSPRPTVALLLGMFLALGVSFPSKAATLIAEYNFDETQPSSVVEDQIGPPFSNGTAVGGGDVNYASLRSSPALNVAGDKDNAITLGKGANNEFQSLLTKGFKIQLDFQITTDDWPQMTLLSMSNGSGTSGGEKAFKLSIFAYNRVEALKNRVYLNIFGADASAETVIVSNQVAFNTPYQVVIEWDPTKSSNQVSVEIWNLDTSTLHGSASQNFSAQSLFPSTAPLLIGRVGQDVNSEAFNGLIDNVKISQVIPEPNTAGLLGVAGCLALSWRALRRNRRRLSSF